MSRIFFQPILAAFVFSLLALTVRAEDLTKLSVEVILQRAQQGNPEAQNELGARYRDGNGVAKDDRKALTWWLNAAQQEGKGYVTLRAVIVLPDSPAALAGFQAGDIIKKVSGIPDAQLSKRTLSTAFKTEGSYQIEIDRGGETKSLTLKVSPARTIQANLK